MERFLILFSSNVQIAHMKDLIKNLIVAGVTIGLSDREAFVTKVSGIISEYQQDPAQADKWAGILTRYVEDMKDNYRMQKVIESSIAGSNMPDQKSIEDLTRAIERLTQTLQEKKG